MIGIDEVQCKTCRRRHKAREGNNRVPCLTCYCGRIIWPWGEDTEEGAIRIDQMSALERTPLATSVSRRVSHLARCGIVKERRYPHPSESNVRCSFVETRATLPQVADWSERVNS